MFFSYLSPDSQNPHGNGLKIDCSSCHTSDSWDFNKNSTFNHNNTSFSLYGQHRSVDCRSCHISLIFSEAADDCISCHADIHQQTVGMDCSRCHTPDSWIISDIYFIHERVTFPLTGVHAQVRCDGCHKNEANLIFSPLGTDCYNCHMAEYQSAKSPDHQKQQFSTDCSLCHSIRGPEWNSGRILHSFFPLQGAHDINDCKICHKSDYYNDLSGECISCHQSDLSTATNPDHSLFPQECELCHSLSPGWKPAGLKDHDSKFPIYSGKHKNEWDNCTDCHTNTNDFTTFNCINCHSDAHHQNQGNEGCYRCHPDGKE